MTQRVKCPQCGKALGVPPAVAGKVGKCGACGTRIAFPPEPPPAIEDTPMERFRASLEQSRADARVVKERPARRAIPLWSPYVAIPLAVLALGLWAAMVVREMPRASRQPVRSDAITFEKFERIQPGMSYRQVVDILGREGTLISHGAMDLPEYEEGGMRFSRLDTRMYSWVEGWGNMNAMFQNDRLINKAQIGLQ
ncbi:MAG: hypothetical protein AB7I57_24330 [Pirellulales bacterium]